MLASACGFRRMPSTHSDLNSWCGHTSISPTQLYDRRHSRPQDSLTLSVDGRFQADQDDLYPDPKTSMIQIEWSDDDRSLFKHRDWGRATREAVRNRQRDRGDGATARTSHPDRLQPTQRQPSGSKAARWMCVPRRVNEIAYGDDG